jgi:hypothetical protein
MQFLCQTYTYTFPIVKLNLYISKYLEFLRIFDIYRLIALLEYLYIDMSKVNTDYIIQHILDVLIILHSLIFLT